MCHINTRKGRLAKWWHGGDQNNSYLCGRYVVQSISAPITRRGSPLLMTAMETRTTRSTTQKTTKGDTKTSDAAGPSNSTNKKRPAPPSDDEELTGDEQNDSEGDNTFHDDEQDDLESINSDNLDDDESLSLSKRGKRASQSPEKTKKAAPAQKSSPRKKRKIARAGNDSGDEDVELELEEGQEIVGRVVQAPKSGRGECCSLVSYISM